MTVASTVATELQDASGYVWIDPYYGLNPPRESNGDSIGHYRKYMTADDDSLVNTTSMARITVDGLTTERQGGYGYYFFNIKEEGDCGADTEGYCDCHPTEYMPLGNWAGEICEACWLEHGLVRGIGKDGCDHK